MKYSDSMSEFYREHNLNNAKLSKLIGVDPGFVSAYARGNLKNKENKLKIEIAIQVIEDYGMRFPTVHEVSYQCVREPDKYEKYFHNIYDQILIAEL